MSGKLDAMFSFDSETTLNTLLARNRGNELGNQFESSVHSVFRFIVSSNVGGSLLEGKKDHLLNQARSELMKQEHQLGSLNNCINDLQQQGYAQRLELEDAHHGYIESRREQARLREELSMKGKVLRDDQIRSMHEMGQIRSMHEMGEMKRTQELRVDEFTMQKMRESHETTQRLTSHKWKNYKKG